MSGLCTAGTGVTDAHQHTTTERAVADLAPFVFRRSHVQIWTYLFLVLTNYFREKFRDNSRKYVGSTDVFFRLVTNPYEMWLCIRKRFERSGVFVQETVTTSDVKRPVSSVRAITWRSATPAG